MQRLLLISLLMTSLTFEACLQSNTKQPADKTTATSFTDEKGVTYTVVQKTEAEWKAELDPLAYNVLRDKGTERAFTGKYNDNKKAGVYACNGCGLTLFSSETKFDSGTGWPSFYAPIDKTHIKEDAEYTLGMKRVEVLCRRCDGHLGHVFDDGPKPTGLRYCMNSVSLSFQPK